MTTTSPTPLATAAKVKAPPWAADERLLALDLYLRTRGKTSYSDSTPVVIDLSKTLRGLKIWPSDVRSDPRFRNPAGVALKLHNFSGIDPDYPLAGMGNWSKGDEETWAMWAHRPTELEELAKRVVSVGSAEELPSDLDSDDDFEADEGEALYRKHRRLERNRALVQRKKARALADTGMLACEVCDYNSKDAVGIEWVIDVHHVVPLHTVGKSKTKLSDLVLVCPTCHRTIHAHKPFITPTDLRAKILLTT
jgi:5-methylcytosine-specific restriction protein A